MNSARLLPFLFAAAVTLFAGCAVAESGFSESPVHEQQDRPAARLLERPDDPQPVVLPEDAAPHDRLTEWWYYTGHLTDASGHLYGFQFVIFQVLRGDFPPSYAAHFAVTDTASGTFNYAERVDMIPPQPGDYPFNLVLTDDGDAPWILTGGDGLDRIVAEMDGYRLEIEMEAQKPPVLHDNDGFFEFAPATESYYYSRTRMNASGILTIDGDPVPVSGEAWMDQQWGDFLVMDHVGWDWFGLQFDNGEELMAWQSRDRQQGTPLDSNATLVQRDGSPIDIPGDELSIEALGAWQSPLSGATYPMGWLITVPGLGLEIEIQPVMRDQELITIESTGNIYWEGMVKANGVRNGQEISGIGYVELTAYASIDPSAVSSAQETTDSSAEIN